MEKSLLAFFVSFCLFLIRLSNLNTEKKNSNEVNEEETDFVQILVDLCVNLSLHTFTPAVVLMKEPIDMLFLYAKSISNRNSKHVEEKRQQKIQEEGIWF